MSDPLGTHDFEGPYTVWIYKVDDGYELLLDEGEQFNAIHGGTLAEVPTREEVSVMLDKYLVISK